MSHGAPSPSHRWLDRQLLRPSLKLTLKDLPVEGELRVHVEGVSGSLGRESQTMAGADVAHGSIRRTSKGAHSCA